MRPKGKGGIAGKFSEAANLKPLTLDAISETGQTGHKAHDGGSTEVQPTAWLLRSLKSMDQWNEGVDDFPQHK
jgi:hypothetical protein